MTPRAARAVAARLGVVFYLDASLRLWAMYSEAGEKAAEYWPPAALKACTAEAFEQAAREYRSEK